MRAVIALAFLAGCSVIGWVEDGSKQVGGEVGGHLAEWIACPLDIESIIECGHVFQCMGTSADTPSGFIEICIDDDDHPEQLDAIEQTYGDCSPTPRHEGLCSYCCGPECGRGCNAFSGCLCE